MFVWFNPVTYNIFEDAGVLTISIERRGGNEIPVHVVVTTQELNATGKTIGWCTYVCLKFLFMQLE